MYRVVGKGVASKALKVTAEEGHKEGEGVAPKQVSNLLDIGEQTALAEQRASAKALRRASTGKPE